MKKPTAMFILFTIILSAASLAFISGCNEKGSQTGGQAQNGNAETSGAGAGGSDANSGSEKFCSTNADCTPKPSCHPEECINKKFKSKYARPETEICTQVIYDWAAYTDQDCACRNTQCINNNKE